tara:strand:- start:2809 stop:3930 length:1122 start_codon:yes stop_codon:yes gene_type:complete
MAYASIPKNKDHYDSVNYKGNGYASSTIKVVNNSNSFRPDWVWTKNMDTGSRHWHVQDSTNGDTKWWTFDDNDALTTEADWTFDITNSGIQIPNSGNRTNTTDENYICGMMKANGGTTSSNSDGSITSTVQANTTAGFSIVKYTGTGENATIGHGLGKKPDWIFVKELTGTGFAMVYSSKMTDSDSISFSTDPETDYLELGHNAAMGDDNTTWNDTAPTTSVFSVGTRGTVNNNTDEYIAYCFAAIKGFTHVGCYRGNGQNDSAFVYTGGKPKTVWIKSASTGAWIMQDEKMNYNRKMGSGQQYFMSPENENAKEAQTSGQYSGQGPSWIDLRANGFKIATSNAWLGDGYKYMYIAFLEEPIVSTNGVPATAR